MRALFAVLLVAISSDAAQFDGRHNTVIKQTLNNYDNDAHIILSDVSIPEVVINKFTPVDADIEAALKDRVAEAAREFVAMSDDEKDDAAIIPPDAQRAKQVKKRSNDVIDVAATMELYKQALDFLDKYDVELRLD